MTRKVHAFSIALGPANPGFTSEQLESRICAARREAAYVMPSVNSLAFGYLQERVESDGNSILLSFDLVESPQLHLQLALRGNNRREAFSAISGMAGELTRLKLEAKNCVIRVGDLAQLASILPSLSDDEFSDAVGSLSTGEAETWKFLNLRRGKELSITFPDEAIGITVPLFPETVSEKGTRVIRCRVLGVCSKYAELGAIIDLGDPEQPDRTIIPCPPKLLIKRPANAKLKISDEWFLLYVAEYTRSDIEVETRLALREGDFQPRHLELVEIRNAGDLVAAVPKY